MALHDALSGHLTTNLYTALSKEHQFNRYYNPAQYAYPYRDGTVYVGKHTHRYELPVPDSLMSTTDNMDVRYKIFDLTNSVHNPDCDENGEEITPVHVSIPIINHNKIRHIMVSYPGNTTMTDAKMKTQARILANYHNGDIYAVVFVDDAGDAHISTPIDTAYANDLTTAVIRGKATDDEVVQFMESITFIHTTPAHLLDHTYLHPAGYTDHRFLI